MHLGMKRIMFLLVSDCLFQQSFLSIKAVALCEHCCFWGCHVVDGKNSVLLCTSDLLRAA